MHWVHRYYWKGGPEGNDIQKTNVPNLRMRFRCGHMACNPHSGIIPGLTPRSTQTPSCCWPTSQLSPTRVQNIA